MAGTIAKAKAEQVYGTKNYVKVRDILGKVIEVDRVNIADVQKTVWNPVSQKYDKCTGETVTKFFIDYIDDGNNYVVYGDYKDILNTIQLVGCDKLAGCYVKFVEMPNAKDKTKKHFELVDA